MGLADERNGLDTTSWLIREETVKDQSGFETKVFKHLTRDVSRDAF